MGVWQSQNDGEINIGLNDRMTAVKITMLEPRDPGDDPTIDREAMGLFDSQTTLLIAKQLSRAAWDLWLEDGENLELMKYAKTQGWMEEL